MKKPNGSAAAGPLPPFFPVDRGAYRDSIRKLPLPERAIMFELLSKWNGYNNGRIPLGTREAAAACLIGQTTACRALKHLQDGGLISRTVKGHVVSEIGKPKVASKWRINFISNYGERHVSVTTDDTEPLQERTG